MESAVWISYDFGVQGDYEGLYSWLDEHGAKECGDSLAFLNYQYGSGSMLDALAADLKKSVQINKRSRVYVIYRDPKSKKMKGIFILGGRKAPPWAGFAAPAESVDSDES